MSQYRYFRSAGYNSQRARMLTALLHNRRQASNTRRVNRRIPSAARRFQARRYVRSLTTLRGRYVPHIYQRIARFM